MAGEPVRDRNEVKSVDRRAERRSNFKKCVSLERSPSLGHKLLRSEAMLKIDRTGRGIKVKADLRDIERDILAIGKVDGEELEVLRKRVYSGGKIDRQTADFLVELHKRVQHRTPAFEKFFYQAIKDHILANGRIGVEKSAWLRRLLLANGRLNDEERQFLHELKGEASQVSQKFETLFNECMKEPPEQRTCGG
jgi:hypothetical protein